MAEIGIFFMGWLPQTVKGKRLGGDWRKWARFPTHLLCYKRSLRMARLFLE